ncbi:MAG: hypothetical protein RLZZ319_841 [Actinomycetota bacterium]|jgi:predicted phage tail protein
MSLSDDERRVLEEMERQLTGADVLSVRAPRRADLKLAAIGLGVFILGLGSLVAGVVIQTPLLGVLGFGVMVVGVLLMLNRRGDTAAPRSSSGPTKSAPAQSTLEDRWQRRMDGEL